jgi:two-component system sensor histidine kinase/response regulator
VAQDLHGSDGATTTRRLKDMAAPRKPLAVLIAETPSGDDPTASADADGLFDAICHAPVTDNSLDTAIREATGWCAKDDHAAGDGALTAAQYARLAEARVLLVEDNDINQQVGRELLESAGVTTDVASDGQEALSVAERARPDVILMDVQMPVMDGYAATAALRRHPRLHKVPVIALTAHAMAGEREKCLNAGMDDYLSKPIEDTYLYRALLKWLPQPAPAPAGTARPARDDAGATVVTPHLDAARTARPTEVPADPSTHASGAGGERAAPAATGDLPAALPGIDVATGLRFVANKPDLYRRMASRFLDRYGDGTAELRQALDAGDLDTAHRWAHSLKNLAGTLGATSLHAAAQEVEQALREPDPADPPDPDLAPLDAALREVIHSLTQLGDDATAASPATAQAMGGHGGG